MTIVLDTPEQINMWVLLSRYSQLSMHVKGYKVAGICKAANREGWSDRKRVGKEMIEDLLHVMYECGYTHRDARFTLFLQKPIASQGYDYMGMFNTYQEVEDFYIDNGNGRQYQMSIVLDPEAWQAMQPKK